MASESPDQDLYHYLGLLRASSLAEPIIFDNSHFLLAGASLKNTDWVLGLVVYTGYSALTKPRDEDHAQLTRNGHQAQHL
jgi:hypothetical protein